MALPTSGPISGSQIAAEVGVSSTNISLGGMADSASFASPDAYSDFYGFSGLTFTSFQTSKKVSSSSSTACSQTVNFARFTSGNPSSVQVGDFIAANSNGTGTIPSGWIRTGTGFLTSAFFINSSSPAEVTSVTGCGGKCFILGARVLMGDNTLKPIEDVKIGDEVKTKEGINALVEDTYVYDERQIRTIYSKDQLKITHNHPVFVNNKWLTAEELEWDSEEMFVDKLYNIQTKDNFIIEGIVVSGTTHEDWFNNVVEYSS
tara:strand:- start:359 stop:1141 length:783 start_codon:yes stop_codon:yes gene_type:complete